MLKFIKENLSESANQIKVDDAMTFQIPLGNHHTFGHECSHQTRQITQKERRLVLSFKDNWIR